MPASEDPIFDASPSVIAHMNEDHADANLDYVRGLGGLDSATSASMRAITAAAISLIAQTPEGPVELQLEFPKPLSSPEEIRPALIQLLGEARKASSRK